MNAITRYLPIPQVSKVFNHLQAGARAQMQAGNERLSHSRTLHAVTAQLDAFEAGLRQSKLQLTEVVAKKIHFRFRLAALKPETDLALQQGYNELHFYEMRLVAYLREGGQALKTLAEQIQTLRHEASLEPSILGEKAQDLMQQIQVLQDKRFALEKELFALIKNEQRLAKPIVEPDKSSKTRQVLGRIRQWLPAA